MGHPVEQLLTSYFTQQEEMGIPSYVVMDKPVQPEKTTLSFATEPPRETKPQPVVENVTHMKTSAETKPVETSEPIRNTQTPPAEVQTSSEQRVLDTTVESKTEQSPQVPQRQEPVQSAVQISTPPQPSAPVATVVPTAEKNHDQIRKELADLYYRSRECSACSLCESRTQVVFGSGNASADIMIVGEAPSFEDDQEGRPFVGQTGQLLTKMLSAINIDREKETFVCNVIKCRPPGNRAPSVQESSTCRPILKRQIAIIQPKIILLLGQTAVTAVIDRPENLNKLRGAELDYHGIPVIVSYHPSELQRNSSLKRPAWDDLQQFQKRYRELINE